MTGFLLIALALRPKEVSCDGADLCIAVVPFGRIWPRPGHAAGQRIAQGIYYRLDDIAKRLNQDPDTRLHINILPPEQLSALKGLTREERAEEADRLAQSLKANVELWPGYGNHNRVECCA